MTLEAKEEAGSTSAPQAGTVRNIGEPFRFKNVEALAGFSAEAGAPGKQMKVWIRLAVTSDEPLFHRLADSLGGAIDHMARTNGVAADVRRSDMVLLILKPNATAELWLDTAAVSIRCLVKRSVAAGSPIFEHDVADITGMTFPRVSFGKADKVLCLFRVDWRFGLAFDMNPEGQLDTEGFTTTLGTLYRRLRYKHLYEALSNPQVFGKLLAAGWFPFTEIIMAEFKELVNHCEAGFALAELEAQIVTHFDAARLQHILERWETKPHFAVKTALLKATFTSFVNKEPVAVLKIVLTEIEGILNDAHRAANNGQGAKLKALLAFAENSAERKAGGSNTLLFPKIFGEYLREHTFATFDPVAQTGSAGSRHAVGHGAAAQNTYTMTRALQAILTLDQLAFYT